MEQDPMLLIRLFVIAAAIAGGGALLAHNLAEAKQASERMLVAYRDMLATARTARAEAEAEAEKQAAEDAAELATSLPED